MWKIGLMPKIEKGLLNLNVVKGCRRYHYPPKAILDVKLGKHELFHWVLLLPSSSTLITLLSISPSSYMASSGASPVVASLVDGCLTFCYTEGVGQVKDDTECLALMWNHDNQRELYFQGRLHLISPYAITRAKPSLTLKSILPMK